MKTKERYIHIDILRAIAILGVMLTHSLAVFLGPDKINIFWNYLHFVVVAFVGCSGYVTAFSYKRLGDMNLLSWYGKRFIRLYIPYALYVVSFALLGLLLPVFFHYTGISYTGKFFLSSFLLTGGVDVGWLTLFPDGDRPIHTCNRIFQNSHNVLPSNRLAPLGRHLSPWGDTCTKGLRKNPKVLKRYSLVCGPVFRHVVTITLPA